MADSAIKLVVLWPNSYSDSPSWNVSVYQSWGIPYRFFWLHEGPDAFIKAKALANELAKRYGVRAVYRPAKRLGFLPLLPDSEPTAEPINGEPFWIVPKYMADKGKPK